MLSSKESVKRQIDALSENQLVQIAEYISNLRNQAVKNLKVQAFWQIATPEERSQDFLQWISTLQTTDLSLIDEAFDRASIYNN